jgi:hypothetical protein
MKGTNMDGLTESEIENYCCATELGYICTLTPNHGGLHIAHTTDNQVAHMWAQNMGRQSRSYEQFEREFVRIMKRSFGVA